MYGAGLYHTLAAFVILSLSVDAIEPDTQQADTSCDYVPGTKVKYVDVNDINGTYPNHIGRDPLPKNVQGWFWFKNDAGDALISFGGPPGSKNNECSNGVLVQKGKDWCTSVSTAHGGGWTFEAVGTSIFGMRIGAFPTMADSFYFKCKMKWEFCFDSNTNPSHMIATPIATAPCTNALSKTITESIYNGISKDYGGHLWKTTTSLPTPFGRITGGPFSPGNFDVVQVMDGNGTKIQPAWDQFVDQNKQVVFYEAPASPTMAFAASSGPILV